MRMVLLAGGIASGKSTVASLLEGYGAHRVDLDTLSREVTLPGMPATQQLAREFGDDVLDADTGELYRGVLASRAFASPERTAALEAIVHPAILQRLNELRFELQAEDPSGVMLVEVPLLDRVEHLISQADEVLCVTCPLPLRRERAVLRGMDAADFDARVLRQPSDEYLVAHATTVIQNDKDEQTLRTCVYDWWHARAQQEKS